MKMTYLRASFRHSDPDVPVTTYSELDDQRMERRKIDIFPDGRWAFADSKNEVGGTSLSEGPIPPLDEINADPEFEVQVIDGTAFEKLWGERHNAEIMTEFPKS